MKELHDIVRGFNRVIARAASVLALAALMASGCSPDREQPEPESIPSEPVTHQTLTGRAPRASGGFPSVVMLHHEGASPSVPAPNEVLLIDQYNMSFSPKLLVARPRQPVQFKNSDSELHNVHVIDPTDGTTIFNVATPMSGAYTYKFDREGAFDVGCDIHPSMAAYIIVTESPYAVIAEPDGSFSLPDVPSGSYRVEVWNLDPSRRLERIVEVDRSSTELVLDPDSS